MARSDLLVSLVKAGSSGDTARARSVAEAIIAEERVKRHNVLADRLTDAMRVNGADSDAAFIGAGQRPHRQFLVELTPRKRLAELVLTDVARPPPGDLAREPAEEARLHVGPVVLLELLPRLRLRGQQEVDDVGRDQAERAVVVLRPAPEVAARQRLVPEFRSRLPNRRRVVRAGVRPVAQQRALDRLFECPLGNL